MASLAFTETMRGFYKEFNYSIPLARDEFNKAFAEAKEVSNTLDFTLTIEIDDIDEFCKDPELEANAIGEVFCPNLGGHLKVINGIFNLFVRPNSSEDFDTAKEMHYLLYIQNTKGDKYTFYGFKELEREDSLDIWDETTTLYTYLWKGHIPYDQSQKEVIGAGILKILPNDFIQQLQSFDIRASSYLEKISTLSKFLHLFSGELWEAYSPFFFGSDTDRWNEHIIPIESTEGVKSCDISKYDFHTDDGLRLSLQRFHKKETKDIVLLLHGLTTSTDMYIMPEHYNLTQYLLDHDYTDVWSLDWRGSGRYRYNMSPYRYTVDDIAKYDIPKAVEQIRKAVGEDCNIHVICHCVGSIAFMASLAAGHIDGIKSVISNSVSLTPKIRWQSKLKITLGPFLFENIMGYPYVSPEMPYMPGLRFGKWIFWMERSIRSACKEPACHMVSFMWGWGFPAAYLHKNLSPITHRRLKDLFGGTPVHYYRHLRKMAYKNETVPYDPRKTSYQVPESYLQATKSINLPPTMFMSGDQNHIFPGSNKLSVEKIKELNPQQNVVYKEFKEYGHQDVFMGKNCDRDVFPELLKFLNENR